jgi:Cupin superfamily protein
MSRNLSMRKLIKTTKLTQITDHDRFYEDFFLKREPVVILGGARQIKAFSKWTNPHLNVVLAGVQPTVRFVDGRVGRIPIDTFLAYLTDPEKFTLSYGAMYLTDFYIYPSFGDAQRDILANDVAFPLHRGGSFAEWISLYAGPAGTSTPWHQDIFSTHTWLAQLRGEKLWRLSAPDLDPLKSFPDDSSIYEVTLNAGDLIYLPPDWWHEVQNQTSTLAISGNFCSFAQAENALVEAQSMPGPNREVSIRTWIEILAQQTETYD